MHSASAHAILIVSSVVETRPVMSVRCDESSRDAATSIASVSDTCLLSTIESGCSGLLANQLSAIVHPIPDSILCVVTSSQINSQPPQTTRLLHPSWRDASGVFLVDDFTVMMLAWRDEIQGNLYDLNNRRVWWGIAYLWFERHDGETVFVLRYVMVHS